MKYPRLLALFCVAVLAASEGWAQYGLYGSPELLRLPPVQSSAAAQHQVPAATAAPAFSFSPAEFASATDLPAGGPDHLMQTSAGPAAPPPVTPPAPQPAGCGDQGVITQMLAESGCLPDSAVPAAQPGDCAPGSLGCAPTEGGAAICCAPLACNWFASAAGLWMTRDRGNRLWTTYQASWEANQMMNTRDVEFQWTGGWQFTVGRYLCCREYGLTATYWGLDNFEGSAVEYAPDAQGLSSPLQWNWVRFLDNTGAEVGTAVEYFDSAAEHRLARQSEVHNLEINFVRFGSTFGYTAPARSSWGAPSLWGCDGTCDCDACNPLAVNWSAGVRWFRFTDDLAFASRDIDTVDWSDPTNYAYLRDRVENNLIGVQCGWDVNYRVACSWQLFARPKIGVYNNHIQHRFAMYRGDGSVADPDTANSGVAGTYPVESSDDVVSFMTEVDLGLNWQMNPWCNAFVGYRVLFATGIALPEEQIPFYVVDIPEIESVDYNGDLVLHGAFAGLEFNY